MIRWHDYIEMIPEQDITSGIAQDDNESPEQH